MVLAIKVFKNVFSKVRLPIKILSSLDLLHKDFTNSKNLGNQFALTYPFT